MLTEGDSKASKANSKSTSSAISTRLALNSLLKIEREFRVFLRGLYHIHYRTPVADGSRPILWSHFLAYRIFISVDEAFQTVPLTLIPRTRRRAAVAPPIHQFQV
jgi:hypothetical protein